MVFGATVVLLALGLLAGPASAKRNVYVTANMDNDVAAFDVAANGALTALGSPVLTGGTGAGPVAITPDGRRLYVANQSSPSVTGFRIAADGRLTAIGPPTPTGGNSAGALAIAPGGRHLYVGHFNSSDIATFAIAPNGTLSAVGAPVPSSGMSVSGIAVAPDGRHLYTTNFNSADVSAYTIGANGRPTAMGAPVGPGADPEGIAIRPDGRSLYIANSDGSSVGVFRITAGGALSALGAPAPAGSTPNHVGITPDGNRLYATNSNGASVSPFAIAANGALDPIGDEVPTGGNFPNDVVATPNGRFLYSSLFGPDGVAGFAIGGNGGLSALAGSPFAAGIDGPTGLAITPDQGPTAEFTVAKAKKPKRVRFDGAGSTDPDGTVATYAWDFGDGETASGDDPTARHRYAKRRVYDATLTVTDNEGCSTQRVFTGQTVSCNGSAVAGLRMEVDLDPPGLKVKARKRQKIGKAIKAKATCDEACEVVGNGKLAIKRRGEGRKAAKSLPLQGLTTDLVANQQTKLKLRLSKKVRRKASKALRNKKVRAKLRFKASDELATSKPKKRGVRMKPKRKGGRR
ncbi:MAG: beta-propeller fold lactonase family protein [Solirubrobacterales bacterium]